jgi:acyl-CoA synthetase (AMP-forming)/AMP-acid ligase II
VAARRHPAIVDCVVVGAPDDRLGEIVTLVVAASPGSDLDEQAVIQHVRSQLASYKAPRRVVFVDSVYRSPSGKSDYRWARDVVAAASR